MTKMLLSSIAAITILILLSDVNQAQDATRYRYNSTMPPGEIGQMQLMRRSAMRGYVQPVQLLAPEGARVSVFDGTSFQDLGSANVTVGMLIGNTYRIKVTQIPGHPGLELFPSVELINRLYAPEGMELKFPVQIHLAENDLTTAANGAIVTRVVYLENPEDAMPIRQQRDDQPYFDVSLGSDPLKVAQQLGRPMAIVRCGTISPDGVEMYEFTFGGSTVQVFPAINTSTNIPYENRATEIGVEPIISQPAIESNQGTIIGDQFQQ